MAKSISIKVGELAKPLKVRKVKAGTTLVGFLTSVGMKMTSDVLVNAARVAGSYKLKNGDLVTSMGYVSGGRGRGE